MFPSHIVFNNFTVTVSQSVILYSLDLDPNYHLPNLSTFSQGKIIIIPGQIYSVPIGGMVQRQAVSIGGSGSSYVYGYVDANFKPNMSKKEAMKFVTNTLTLAMLRDGSSGGVVRLGVITEQGVERHVVLGDQLPKFYEG